MRRCAQSLIVSLGTAIMPSAAPAEDAGLRAFPATLVVDEPQVETEVSPQMTDWSFGDRRRRDISSELSLQIARPLSVIISPAYTFLPGGIGGFQPLGLGVKYQFVANAEHEFIVSAGISSTLGGTGSAVVGADTFTSIIPTVYYGRGAGDLPDLLSWARPFALTGEIGFEIPTRSRARETDFGVGRGDIVANPTVASWQGSLLYSFAYAVEHENLEILRSLSELVPIVEYDIDIPIFHNSSRQPTVGTINPGFLLVDDERRITWGLEALIPINKASGNHPGARLQLSYSFDPPWHLVGDAPH